MLESPSGETLLYPILGDPIRFVRSPQRLTEAFRSRGYNGICVPMLVPEGALESFLSGLQRVSNVRGLLITMPHKKAMFEHCATASKTSKLLRAVSIVRRNPDDSWHGDMLDGLSFVRALQQQGAELRGARVLQIGAGSAGSAIAVALLDAGVAQLSLYDTDQARLEGLVQLLASRGKGDVAATPDPAGYDIVLNTTPLGMSADDGLPVPANLLRSTMFVGDVVAGHGMTPFLQAARTVGCKTADGFQMVEAGMKLMPDFLLSS